MSFYCNFQANLYIKDALETKWKIIITSTQALSHFHTKIIVIFSIYLFYSPPIALGFSFACIFGRPIWKFNIIVSVTLSNVFNKNKN